MASPTTCTAYRWPVGNDAHAWLLTFPDSARVILGRAVSQSAADFEIGDTAFRYGYPDIDIIPLAPSEAYGQPRQEVARA